MISKKRILLIKEKQEKHKEFTIVNNGKRNNNTKHPLLYSNRRNKIRKGRNPNNETNQRGSSDKTLITEPQFSPHPQKPHQFRSDQIVHIKQSGTKSHILELCFPSQ